MSKIKMLFIMSLLILITSCSNNITNRNNNCELVMSPGMIIEAENEHGPITIEAIDKLTRVFKWNDREIKLKLIPRYKRWYGSKGAYKPSGKGNVHAVIEEGQHHFCSEKEAIEWLPWQHYRFNYVYTSDGLVIGWYQSGDPNSDMIALCVKIWRFYINQQKPNNLSGAKNNKINISFKPGFKEVYPPVGDFVPSKPKIINGRMFSGKAIDLMSDRGYQQNDIERCIKKPSGKYKRGINTVYQSDKQRYLWVEVDKTGRVVLIGN